MIAALAAILGFTTASASAAGVAVTRVGAFNVTGQVLVEPPEHIAAGQRPEEPADRVAHAVATGVAAETATTATRSVDEVLSSLPKGKQSLVRTVPDEETLQSTFGELTRGGTPTSWKGYSGQVIELDDGTQIGLRVTSRTGGSTIDIRVPGQDPFKIHIG